jgi:type II secretory pathway predicted ATPase ExeA
LGSSHFDSRNLLTIVLCGDLRLPDRFRTSALVSLGSRIRFRMNLEPYNRNDLLDYMAHCLKQAGAPHIMTQPLVETMVDHCGGNLRVLNNMAAELLAVGIHKQAPQLDEKLFIEVFSRKNPSRPSK